MPDLMGLGKEAPYGEKKKIEGLKRGVPLAPQKFMESPVRFKPRPTPRPAGPIMGAEPTPLRNAPPEMQNALYWALIWRQIATHPLADENTRDMFKRQMEILGEIKEAMKGRSPQGEGRGEVGETSRGADNISPPEKTPTGAE